MQATIANPPPTEADDELDSPSRVEAHEARTMGERIADAASAAIGSWRFIIIQTILVIIWVALNLAGVAFQWDPYPFILLNLMFSVQAAYTGPILLLASNRQSAKDRAMAERDDEELGIILKLQQDQMDVLALLRKAQDSHSEVLQILRNRAPA
jgi:uncharacterized membrane protein